MSGGPVCSSFSTAIVPAWRTLEHPLAVFWATPQQREKLDLGNRFAGRMYKASYPLPGREPSEQFYLEAPWVGSDPASYGLAGLLLGSSRGQTGRGRESRSLRATDERGRPEGSFGGRAEHGACSLVAPGPSLPERGLTQRCPERKHLGHPKPRLSTCRETSEVSEPCSEVDRR